MRTLSASFFIWFGLLACSSSDDSSGGGFDVFKYDKTCTTPADCVVVFSGDPCSCTCDVAAVSQAASLDVNSDRQAYQKAHCPEGLPSCGACAAPPATTCNDGQCGLE